MSMRSITLAAAVTLALAGMVGQALATSPVGAETAAAPPVKKGRVSVLSDEQTVSRWASPQTKSVVHRKPALESPAVGRLRFDTEDGLAEVYLLLRGYTDAHGRQWVRVRLPARPNGQTGWVLRSAFGAFHRIYSALRIDRESLRATLTRHGKVVWSARVGVGKASTPTPSGRFYVRERLIPRPGTLYGKLAFGLSAYARVSDWPGGGVVGLHGTDQPALIPGRPSHGCIRLKAEDLKRLGGLLQIGTPVRIS